MMILSQKKIEEIAAAVTEDFNKFFFAWLEGHRLTSLPRITLA